MVASLVAAEAAEEVAAGKLCMTFIVGSSGHSAGVVRVIFRFEYWTDDGAAR